jgi:hypothetical protein
MARRESNWRKVGAERMDEEEMKGTRRGEGMRKENKAQAPLGNTGVRRGKVPSNSSARAVMPAVTGRKEANSRPTADCGEITSKAATNS